MRKLSHFILILFFSSNLQSQTASPATFEIKSSNGKYIAKVVGSYYEGFVGPQKIQLLDSLNHIYWEKTFPRRGLHLPCVSNVGTVVVTKWSQLFLFNTSGDTLWNFNLDKLTFWANEGENVNMVQEFSDSGELYFAFIGIGGWQIACFSIPEKREKWRLNLGQDWHGPCNIELYNSFVMFNDFCGVFVNQTNHCYVVDFNGNIHLKIPYNLKNPNYIRNVSIDEENNELHIETINGLKKYSFK